MRKQDYRRTLKREAGLLQTGHLGFYCVYIEEGNRWYCPDLELSRPSLTKLREAIGRHRDVAVKLNNIDVWFATRVGRPGYARATAVETSRDRKHVYILTRNGSMRRLKATDVLPDTEEVRQHIKAVMSLSFTHDEISDKILDEMKRLAARTYTAKEWRQAGYDHAHRQGRHIKEAAAS